MTYSIGLPSINGSELFGIIILFFLEEGEDSFETGFPHILSQQEHDVLKAIRHNYQDLKSVNIRFKDNKPQLLEIKMMKKVQVESRILELIKSGEYATLNLYFFHHLNF